LHEASDADRKLQVLLRLSKSLAQQIELEPLLKLMVVEVTAAMQAERSNLLLLDREKRDELVTRVADGVGAREIRIPFGVGIAGAAAQTRQIINVPDPYQDSRFNSAIDKASGFRTRSLLAVPVIAEGGQLMGVAEVMNKIGGGAFTAEDERFLEAICSDLSIALRRAEMVEAHLHSQIVTKSLELARDIQMGLLPRDFPALPEFKEVDIFATMIPALEVGGDLYDFFPLDGDRICFVIGDVSDKGIPAALFMMMARTAFKMSAIASPESISLTMSRVNQFLLECNQSQMFVTALAGILDLQTGRVEYADAGHEPPFILRPSGEVLKVEKVGGVALGFCPDLNYLSGVLQLSRGDALVLYTDGVNEAMNTGHQLFGADAIERTLSQVGHTASSEKIIQGMLDNLHVFVGGAQQSDDITMLVIRYLGRDASCSETM
jgi:serine phosphatase RsbU (regulator of sigma subunit)